MSTVQKAEYQQLSRQAWQGQGRVGCMIVPEAGGDAGLQTVSIKGKHSQCTCNSEELCGPHLPLHDELIHGADVVLRWRQGDLLLVGRGDQGVRQRGRPVAAWLLRPAYLGLQDMTQLTLVTCNAYASLHPHSMAAKMAPLYRRTSGIVCTAGTGLQAASMTDLALCSHLLGMLRECAIIFSLSNDK